MKSYKKAVILPILTSLLFPACNSTPTHKHNWGEVSYNWPEKFEKRLNSVIKKTKENKIIASYGGSDKYYKLNVLL